MIILHGEEIYKKVNKKNKNELLDIISNKIKTKNIKGSLFRLINIGDLNKRDLLKYISIKGKRCNECGKTFDYIHGEGHRNHCSNECFRIHKNKLRVSKYSAKVCDKRKVKKKKIKCKACGKESISSAKKHFCNSKCNKLFYKLKYLSKKQCKCCGKSFIGTNRDVYCSNHCSCIGLIVRTKVSVDKIMLIYKGDDIKYFTDALEKYKIIEHIPIGIQSHKKIKTNNYDKKIENNNFLYNKYIKNV